MTNAETQPKIPQEIDCGNEISYPDVGRSRRPATSTTSGLPAPSGELLRNVSLSMKSAKLPYDCNSVFNAANSACLSAGQSLASEAASSTDEGRDFRGGGTHPRHVRRLPFPDVQVERHRDVRDVPGLDEQLRDQRAADGEPGLRLGPGQQRFDPDRLPE